MRRIFWLAIGLGAGTTAAVMVNRWIRRQRARMAPSNIGRQAGSAVGGLKGIFQDALSEFRAGKEEKEAEIRAEMA